MRNRWLYLLPIVDYLGVLFGVFAVLLLVPTAVQLFHSRSGLTEAPPYVFPISAGVAAAVGLALKRNLRFQPLDNRQAIILCALGWILISGVGALPFHLALGINYLDAYFEAVSGFTTAAMTTLHNIDGVAPSILFWRAFMQWLGGLGILTFFLAVVFTGGSAHRLFSAESQEIFVHRPFPSLTHTVRFLWGIYMVMTAAIAAAFYLEGMSVFDSICHSMGAISTGGYSTHQQSIGYFTAEADYRHFALIQYTVIVAMLLGSINFLVYYRVLSGNLQALWHGLEMRLWWGLLATATVLVVLNQVSRTGWGDLEETFRAGLFQVVSVGTTTGFTTRDLYKGFPTFSREVFLVLMVVGGCVGSTSGGMKVLRVGVFFKLVQNEVRRLVYGPATLNPVVVDGTAVQPAEIRRIAGLFSRGCCWSRSARG